MAFAHSFADDFYGDPYNTTKSERPTTVCDALASMDDEAWRNMCVNVFGCGADNPCMDIDCVLAKVRETDTVSNLDTPVSVWIDSDGFYTVDVYDSAD